MSEGRVVVLGCGPAGLMVAQTATMAGRKVYVVAPKKEKSVISGAQYLHSLPDWAATWPVPKLTLNYRYIGTEEGYRKKIYGEGYVGPVSWGKYDEQSVGYSLQYVYERLWDSWHGPAERDGRGSLIVEQPVTPDGARLLAGLVLPEGGVVFSTAPRPSIFPDHKYLTARIWVTHQAVEGVPDNTIVYNGDPGAAWYRSSMINGVGSTEYPGDRHPRGVSREVLKPLEAHGFMPLGIVPLGRYGKWQKGVLVDDAFKEAEQFLFDNP